MNMQNFDDIKNLWQQKNNGEELPSVKEILSRIGAARKKMMRKNMLGIILLSFTFVFITWIGFYYDFQLATTRIGIILTLIAIVMGITFNTRLAGLLIKQNDPTLSNSDYLKQLIEYRNRQRFIQTTGISAYFILLTIGIILYMYEFASRSLMFGICSYGITLIWIAFNWFYTRKRAMQKQEKEINTQIALLEGLANNLR